MITVKILIDGDSCPVIEQTTKIAKEHFLKLIIVKNINHRITSDYAKVVSVDLISDSADLYIANHTNKGDIVISQDYGLAALILAKKGYIVTPNGIEINDNNIDSLLHQRFIASQMRRQGQSFGSKAKKRKSADNRRYINVLKNLIISLEKEM